MKAVTRQFMCYLSRVKIILTRASCDFLKDARDNIANLTRASYN